MELPTVLKNAQHPNHDIRKQAEDYLNRAAEEQYGPFLLALTVELANESNDPSSRQLAGLFMKNLITAQDDAILENKRSKWLSCDPALKDQVRMGLLASIQAKIQIISHTAAQVLAAYGAVDLPRNEFPTLLQTLFHNVSSPEVHDGCKVSSLEALGYMCDIIETDSLDVTLVNQILSSIIDGMRNDRTDTIRLAGVSALNNALDFAHRNFEVDVERNAIMTAICEATQAKDMKIRERAFECAATVAALYYEKLPPYAETLFNLSTTAIRTDDAIVGMQAIEFWNTVCDQECNVLNEIDDGDATAAQYLHLAEQASGMLVPLLLECMTKQEDDEDDDDTWNIAMAGATLIESIARTIQDKIVDLVLPFVTQNINANEWRLKEAALMAFGVILDGPSPDKLAPIVAQALPIVINCIKDKTTQVRDTSAWVLAKICELHKNCISGDSLQAMVQALGGALDDKEIKVVNQACFAVHNLAEACAEESESASNILSHFMPQMLQRLMVITAATTTTANEGKTSLKSTAYEAVNVMVANSALDMKPLVLQLLVEALNRLEQTFNPAMSATDRTNVQSCLCSLVGEIVKKVDSQDIQSGTDRIMQLLLQVFTVKGAIAHEDALLAMGNVVDKMGDSFNRYVKFVQGPLLESMRNIEEYQLCTVAVGVVGDLCRAVGKNLLPYCDDIMRCLLELLQSPVINRLVKPHVISIFADVAMAIEGDFERYTSVILGVLKQAGEIEINTDDEDLIEYINTLRNAILEAYTGIVQGLKGANKHDLLLPAVPVVIEFIQKSGCDENRSGEVLKSAVGLIGDLGQTFGSKMQPVFAHPFVSQLVQQAIQNGSDAQEVGTWAQSVVTSILKAR